MKQVDKKWVDNKMRMLSSRLGIFKMNPLEFYFEPDKEIYKRLSSGEEKDLQYVSLKIASHLGITYIPTVRYDWGLKMGPEVAGQAKITNISREIRIPLFLCGEKICTGKHSCP